jgi:putative toxin-antitoxin system antitoxin component (TIGR02293 family)
MTASSTTARRERRAVGPPATRPPDWGGVDARVLSLFADRDLLSRVRRLPKVELAAVRHLTARALEKRRGERLPALAALDVHRRVSEGLAGEALLIAASMFLDSLADAEGFFELSFKTIKSKLGKSLDVAASERAMRAARVAMAAAEVLGSFDAARKYMHTRNFALGGATPAELLKTAEGERLVLGELHAHAEGGPI